MSNAFAYAADLMTDKGLSYAAAARAAGVYEPDLRTYKSPPPARPVVAVPTPARREPLRFLPPVASPWDRYREVVAGVAKARGVTVAALMGVTRSREVAHARQEAMYELHSQFKLTLPQIGRFFSRDHTTILHGIRAHKARMVAIA